MYDEESDLYDLKARFYDAKIARFMQQDSYLGSQADPLSLNLYAYCNNNPIKYWDPTGHVLSDADKRNLTSSQQRAIEQITRDWDAAKAAYDKASTQAEKDKAAAAMDKAHKDAEAIRNTKGYSGGADGSGSGIKVRDVLGNDNTKWNEKDRTITYTNADGKKVTLKESDNEFYVGSDGRAYFYNNVRTIMEAAGAKVDHYGELGAIVITAPKGKAMSDTMPKIITDMFQKPATLLMSGRDYYIGWDGKAHFVDSDFGLAPPAPRTGGMVTFYDQTDEGWGSTMYSNHDDKSQTIGKSGCGPTSLAMIISTLTGQSVTPDIIAAACIEGDYRTYNDGTSWSFVSTIAPEYELNTKVIYSGSSDNSIVEQSLNSNTMILASVRAGYLTSSGHYIVIAGMVNIDGVDYFDIYDSNYSESQWRYSKYSDVIKTTENTGQIYMKKDALLRDLAFAATVSK